MRERFLLGFFLTILYVAIIFVRPQEFISEMRGWPILDFLAVGCISFLFLEGSFSAAKFRRSPISLLLILFWLAIICSNLASGWFSGGIKGFEEFAKVYIVYLLIIFSVDTFRKLKLFVWTMVCMGSFLAAQSMLLYYTGQGLVSDNVLMRGDIVQTRGIGIFADPNDLAINIIPLVAFVLPAFHKTFLSRTWVSGLFFLIPMVLGIAFTRSRGGILGLAMVGWYYFYRRVGVWGSVVPVLVMLSFLLALPRMGEINTKEASARSRLDHWSYGMQLLRSNPLFGVGYSRFTEHHSHTAHNSFILVLAELGLFGGFAWICIFYCSFWEIRMIRRLPRPPPYLDSMLDSLVCAFLGWLVSAFFLSQSYKPLPYMLMAILVAALNVLDREGFKISHRWSLRQTSYCLGITMAGVVFIYAAINILWRI